MPYPIIARHLLLLLTITVASSAGAATFRWVDDSGQVHFGDVIPPEYAEKRKEELNEQGFIIDTIEGKEVKDPEQEAAEQERLKEEARQLELAEKQRKYAALLLRVYESEEALILTRDKRLGAIESQITHAQSQVTAREDVLVQLQKQAADRERAGKKVGEKLLGDIATTQRQIKEQQARIAELQIQADETRARFDADLAIYRKASGK